MLSRTRKVRPKTIDLNLIPLELRKPFFTRRTLLVMGGLVLGVALFFLIDGLRAATEWQIYELEGQAMAAKQSIQKENGRIATEQAESAKVEQEIKRLKEDIARFNDNPQFRTRRLIALAPAVQAALDSSQPAGVQLTTLAWQEPRLTVHGRAPSTQQIMAFADRLEKSGRFSKVDPKVVTAAPATSGAGSPSTPPTAAAGDFLFTIELAVPAARSAG